MSEAICSVCSTALTVIPPPPSSLMMPVQSSSDQPVCCWRCQQLSEVNRKLSHCDESISDVEQLLALMREQRNAVSERILKLKTLRHGRR